MSGPEPSSTRNAGHTSPPAEQSSRHPGLLSADIPASLDRGYEGSLIVFGYLWAFVIADLLLQKLSLRFFSLSGLVFKAGLYIVLTIVAGTAGIWLTGFLRSRESSFGLGTLSRTAGVGWIFVPCITLFFSANSLWVVPAVALATVIVAFNLRMLFPALIELEKASDGDGAALPSLYGLPPIDSHPLRAVFIALCAQGALLFAFKGSTFLALLFFALALYLLTWRWTASDRHTTERLTGNGGRTIACAAAVLLTMIALLPKSFLGGYGTPGLVKAAGRASPDHLPGVAQSLGSGYVGIILWPPPPKKSEILPPAPRADSFLGHPSQPFVIPFDGPYWYFRPPSQQPGPSAHIAHAKSTDVNIRSNGWLPLRMEAHQNLGLPIDLSCCSEIDVALTNADTRPGTITVGILLTDSHSPGTSSLNLGQKLLASSTDSPVPPGRPPVSETLRFMIPNSKAAAIRHFDKITVVFEPSKERTRMGAKVAVQNFRLIPR